MAVLSDSPQLSFNHHSSAMIAVLLFVHHDCPPGRKTAPSSNSHCLRNGFGVQALGSPRRPNAGRGRYATSTGGRDHPRRGKARGSIRTHRLEPEPIRRRAEHAGHALLDPPVTSKRLHVRRTQRWARPDPCQSNGHQHAGIPFDVPPTDPSPLRGAPVSPL